MHVNDEPTESRHYLRMLFFLLLAVVVVLAVKNAVTTNNHAHDSYAHCVRYAQTAADLDAC